MEIRKELKRYKVYKECDKCTGKMIYSGHAISRGKITDYSHICNRCDKEISLERRYPYEIEEESAF